MQSAKRITLALGLAAGLGVTVAGLPQTASAAGWEPKKPVELIIMAGPGGGADQIARLLQGLIEQKGLSPKPFIPINKPGGSGAEALRYLQDKAGDDHTVMITLNSFYTTPLINKDLGVDVTKFTPLGLMAMDTFLLWVPKDDKAMTIDDWAGEVKSEDSYTVGGTGKGQEDSILFAMLGSEFGLDNITYIPFPGGGTVAKNLVGGHIEATVNNPSEQIEFWRAGDTKPIVQFTDKRMSQFPDVPTAKEEGHDIEYYMQRSFNGPPGMSPEAQAWYVNLFKTLFESKEWQDYCKSDGLTCDVWVGGADLGAFHEKQLERHKELIDKVGAKAISGE
jgi:putative tricarboxylic transport membrane protein